MSDAELSAAPVDTGESAPPAVAEAVKPLPFKLSAAHGLMVLLLGAALSLSYLLWLAPNRGVNEVRRLRSAIEAQRVENARLEARNAGLKAEIVALKSGAVAVEEQARAKLGMIRPGETFYHILERAPPPTSKKSPSAPGQ